MRFLKLSIILLVVLALVAPIASAQDSGEGLTIGFSQIGSESAWRTAFTEAVQAEAEARGINLLFGGRANGRSHRHQHSPQN
jgi:simple sugar transport system substrate-binding protein